MRHSSLSEMIANSSHAKFVEDQKAASFKGLSSNFENIPKHQVATNSYTGTRNEDIRNALKVDDNDKIVNPTDIELTYVNSVFQNKGFHKIENVTYEAIMNIGRAEFTDMNNKMKEFTRSMGGVDTAGICDLMGDLSQSLDKINLEEIWQKAVSAKPSLWVKFLSMFDKQARSKSLNQTYDSLKLTLQNNGKLLETKLVALEVDLEKQQKTQEKNIKDLEKSFEVYYNAFIELRKQFALIVYLEHSFKLQLETFKAQNSGVSDLVVNKQLKDYEARLMDIHNKRMIIHKSMIQLPIIVEQNSNLVGVCKVLLTEIENTRVSSFPLIRGNMQTIGTAIMTQKALNSNQSIADLEKNAAVIAMKVTGDLAKKGATLAASQRLKEAETVKMLFDGMKSLRQDLDNTKSESQQMFDSAKSILNDVTNELIILSGGK